MPERWSQSSIRTTCILATFTNDPVSQIFYNKIITVLNLIICISYPPYCLFLRLI